MSSIVAADEVSGCDRGRRRARRTRRHRARRPGARAREFISSTSAWRWSITAATFSAWSRLDATLHHVGIVSSMRLRWSSVKLMSIGRVCTCGHTAAPRARARATASITLTTPWWFGIGVEQRRERRRDAVAKREVVELLDTGDGDVGVEELGNDLEHRVELAEHGGQRVELVRRRPIGWAPDGRSRRRRRSWSTARRRRRRGTSAGDRPWR